MADLSTEKLQHLETTLAFILALPSVQDIYAQIIDGNPTWKSYVDPNTLGDRTEKTIVSDHPNPSHEAMQLYEEIRKVFRPQALNIDIQVSLSSITTGFCTGTGTDSDEAGPELPKCPTG